MEKKRGVMLPARRVKRMRKCKMAPAGPPVFITVGEDSDDDFVVETLARGKGKEVVEEGGEGGSRGGKVRTRGGKVVEGGSCGGKVRTRGGKVRTRGGKVRTRGGKVRTRGGKGGGSELEVQIRLQEDARGDSAEVNEMDVQVEEVEAGVGEGVQNVAVEGKGGDSAANEMDMQVEEVEARVSEGVQNVAVEGQGCDAGVEEQVGEVAEVEEPMKQKRKQRTIISGAFEGQKMTTRNSPKVLRNTILQLNDIQKAELEEIGFRDCCYLDITEIPSKFGRWLVESFDPDKCALRVNEGWIKITPKRVAKILGIPRGTEKIVLPTVVGKGNKMVKRWRFEMGLENGSVNPCEVSQEVLKNEQGGEWFKVQFLVLFSTIMIESNRNGSCNIRILHILDDLSKVASYDWCGFLVDKLVSTTRDWQKAPNSAYSGPLTFLAIFYCEMCEAKGYTDQRKEPVLKGWSTTSLRKRVYFEMKNGGFGLGRVRRRYRKGMEIIINPRDEEGTSISKVKGKKNTMGTVEDGMAVAESSKRKAKKKMRAVEVAVAVAESSKRKAKKKKIFRAVEVAVAVAESSKRKAKNKKMGAVEDGVAAAESSKRKAEWDQRRISKRRKVSQDEEVVEAIDLSVDGHKSNWERLIRDNDILHIPFGVVESRSLTMEEASWERLSVGAGLVESVGVDVEGDMGNQGVEAEDEEYGVEREKGEEGIEVETVVGDVFEGVNVESGVGDEAGVGVAHGGDVHDVGVHEDDQDRGEEYVGNEGVLVQFGVQNIVEEAQVPSPFQMVSIEWSKEQGEEVSTEKQRQNEGEHSRTTDPYKACIEEVRGAAQHLSDAMMNFDSIYGEALMKYPQNDELQQIDRDLMIQMGTRAPNSEEQNYRSPQPSRQDEFREWDITAPRRNVTAEETEEVEKALQVRNKRKIVVSDIGKSPYVLRICDIHKADSVAVKRIADWLFSLYGERGDLVYEYMTTKIERIDFESLDKNSPVLDGVIEAWTQVLNHEEALRSKESPRRFFFTVYIAAMGVNMESEEDNYEGFKEIVENQLGMMQGNNLLGYDMLFFPMNRAGEYYLLVVNLKNPAVEILDSNKGVGADMTTYGNQPSIMISCLARYLKELGYSKALILERSLISKPKLRWATNESVDNGVFLMRHMESYMGLKGKSTWKTQLGVEGHLLDRQIIKLRSLFAWKILTSPINGAANSVYAKATEWDALPQADKLTMYNQKSESQQQKSRVMHF